MKVVILAGGYGTRISEESHLKPKPMLGIGEMPMLWHIMKIYSTYGYHDFVICCGYKQYIIKEWFANYYLHQSDISFDFTSQNQMTVHNNADVEPWRVTLVDTGLDTMTGGRIKRIQKYIGNEPFFLTYGDGVADVNISELVKFHKKNGKLATLTTVNPGQRFGVIDIDKEGLIHSFREKSTSDGFMINGGFMVFQPQVFDYISGDAIILEREPLEKLAEEGQLCAYKHKGFWHCMDTQRDKQTLEKLWASGEAPWKVWK